MKFLTFTLSWILLLCFVSQIYTLGIGKVFIGYMQNSSLLQTNLNPVKSNASTISYNLPVYIRVFADHNGTQPGIPITDNVSVECETNKNFSGFTTVSFTSLILSEDRPEGIIKISLIKAGRPVEVRCFGNSILPPGNNTLPRNDTLQFIKETSISDPWPLIVPPKPTVSICKSPIMVPEASSSFRVEFSEPVADFPVIVSCNPVDPAVVELVIADVSASINSTFVRMIYNLTNGSLVSPVKVLCSAKYVGVNQSDGILPGNPGWFVPKVVDVSLITSSDQVKGPTFKAFLTHRGLSGQNIHVQCFTDAVDSRAEATRSVDSIICPRKNSANLVNQTSTPGNISSTTQTTPVSLPSTTPTSMPIRKNMWSINNPNFTLKAEGATLQLRRRSDAKEPTLELVVLTCCISLTPGLQTLQKKKLTLSVTVSLNPSTNYNESQLLSMDEIRASTLGNPANPRFANCPCDMTLDNCDVNCCCDKDCNAADINTFQKCIPGFQGGQPLPAPEWMCNSLSSCRNPFLCVRSKDSATLGLFRYDRAAISNLIGFKAEWMTKAHTLSKTDSANPAIDDFNYKSDSPIRISIPNGFNPVPTLLTLPQRTFSGQCATTAPIPFLVDFKSDCVYRMTRELCSDDSILSATTFALSTTLRVPSCPAGYAILNGGEHKFVLTDVNYYCTDDPQPYLKSSDTLSDIFASKLDSSQNFTIPDTCTIDSAGVYHCPNNVKESFSAQDKDLPPRCPWDDGYTRPPTPTSQSNGTDHQCNNVVLSVYYQFDWSGNELVFLNASVILGNVSLFNVKKWTTLQRYSEVETDPLTNVTRVVSRNLIQNKTLNETTVLSPRYKVKYMHKFSDSSSDRSDGQQAERSGNPGYDFGRPIWSGTSVIDETNDEFSYVNQHETQQMAMWDPSPSGLCSMSGKRKITFGEDLFSSCVIPLTLDSLNDCQNLRKWLLYQLSVLMPSDRIGRYGSNNANISSDWIQVIRESLSDRYPEIVPMPEFNITNTTINDNSSSSSGIPPTTTNTPTTQATKQNLFSNTTCTQVPAGIVLDIMYAKTGLVYGAPFREIIGAKVTYVFENWSFTCDVNGRACVSPPEAVNNTNPEVYQLFPLTAVVHFIQVPVTKPKPIIRYRELWAVKGHWYDYYSDIFSPIMREPGEGVAESMKKLAITLIFVFVAILCAAFLQVT